MAGHVLDETGAPLSGATILVRGTGIGTSADSVGAFSLELEAGRPVTLSISYVGFDELRQTVTPTTEFVQTVEVRLRPSGFTLQTATVRDERARREAGTVYLDPAQAAIIPGPGGGIEALIKIAVGSNNELTSQYAVRGGNFDENLVYVNDFEIQRPYLVRSGQQEGLSFINADLVSGVQFSLGGFGARYGDRLSSVLDVTYRRPRQFGGSVVASLLGVSAHLEGTGKKTDRFQYLIGLRQKSNQYLLQAQPTQGVYNPTFTDVQALLRYRISARWEAEVIGNYARNRFNFIPQQSEAAFGLLNQAFLLTTYFEGSEIDRFDTRFVGTSVAFQPNEKLRLKWLLSGYQTDERETYDIAGGYRLAELETDIGKSTFGEEKAFLGFGIIQTHARNYLKVDVGTAAHRGSYAGGRHFVQWGADVQGTRITDRLLEWERRDSFGFTQPYSPDATIRMRTYLSTAKELDYARISGFVQDNWRPSDSLDLTISAGVRAVHSTLNGETVISPRVNLSYKPRRADMVYKLAAGVYAQPPFYRELRDITGVVNEGVRAQKSAHFVGGVDYNFRVGRRPFKWTAEAYYKHLWDLVPYEYDNVRIRYFGRNASTGYAYGGEVRLYGDLVPDAPSWISIGVLNTQEDIAGDRIAILNSVGEDSAYGAEAGYIPRPSDQRFMLGLFLQDYLPRLKSFRVHLAGLYSSGLPFGPPDGRRYADTLRLPAYKRVDIGFSAQLLDGAKGDSRPSHSAFRNLNSIWLSLEVFNLLGIQNTLSYSYIQDQSTGLSFAVPNRLTTRLLNVKMIVRF